MKAVNAGLAFGLEILMIAAFAYFGATLGDGRTLHFALGIGIPVLAVLAWGLFAAPRATRRFEQPYLLLFKIVMFAAAALAIVAAASIWLGALFAVLAIVSLALEHHFGGTTIDDGRPRGAL